MTMIRLSNTRCLMKQQAFECKRQTCPDLLFGWMSFKTQNPTPKVNAVNNSSVILHTCPKPPCFWVTQRDRSYSWSVKPNFDRQWDVVPMPHTSQSGKRQSSSLHMRRRFIWYKFTLRHTSLNNNLHTSSNSSTANARFGKPWQTITVVGFQRPPFQRKQVQCNAHSCTLCQWVQPREEYTGKNNSGERSGVHHDKRPVRDN